MTDTSGTGDRPARTRRRVFAAVTVACTAALALGGAELGLRWWPQALGFERLAYLPEPLKHALGPRFVAAYQHTGRAYFAQRAAAPQLVNTVPHSRYGLLLGEPGAPQPATPDRPIATDALGFRNPAVPEHAALLVVGDSFTAGVSGATVWPREDLFATRVGRALDMTAYQAACYGWGPRQFALAVAELAPRLRPEYVIIATYFDNDLGDVWVYDGWKASGFATYAEFRMYRGLALRQNPHPTGLDAHSVLANLVRFSGERTEARPIPLPHVSPPNAARYRDLPLVPMEEIPGAPALAGARLVEVEPGSRLRVQFTSGGGPHEVTLRWQPEDARGSARAITQLPWWPPYADAIATTVSAVRDAGAEPVLVLIPSRERVLAPAVAAARLDTAWPLGAHVVPDGGARAVASLAHLLEAGFVDVGPTLRAAVAEGAYPFREDDIHFNAVGHGRTATAIADYLRTHPANTSR